ncbi:MAG: hypothetical protein ABI036_03090 [Fibrobacteria bacterium]
MTFALGIAVKAAAGMAETAPTPVPIPEPMETPAQDWVRPLKIAFRFRSENAESQMALTRDSVGMLPLDPTAGALEPDDENGFDGAVRKRALSPSEKDSAGMFLNMTRIWKGSRRYICPNPDRYTFTIWSDSLTLHCENCFSCSEGVGMGEARMLARFGGLTLWLNNIRYGLNGEQSEQRARE